MNISQSKFNTKILILLALALLGVQFANYVVGKLMGGVLPMGRLMTGLSIYGSLAILYWRNGWHRHNSGNVWRILYLVYIVVSFVYGVKRYGTMTASIFDLWLFLFIPAILVIPPFSFDVRVFDRILAGGVLLSIPLMAVVVAAKPGVLYDRGEFSFYVSPLASFGVGAGYLLLKHAMRVNVYTYIGLVGVLTNAVLFGFVGAFRGQLLLSSLMIMLFLAIQLRTIRISFGWKALSFGGLAVGLLVVMLLAFGKFQEQVYFMLERFMDLFDAYKETGDVARADSRLAEMEYFMQLNSNWKLILGHGVGGLWYDFYGMFKFAGVDEGQFAGARTMLHINWLHIVFKIGGVGFFLMLAMLVRNYRLHRVFLRQNLGWWAFLIWYIAFSTYYGDKRLGIGSMIHIFVLVHPWIFHIKNNQGNASPGHQHPARWNPNHGHIRR